GRRPQSRADCLLWALLGFFLLVEGLVLSTAFLPSFDAAAQQQEQEQRPQHPAPTAAGRQKNDDPFLRRPREIGSRLLMAEVVFTGFPAQVNRAALGRTEDGTAANFTSRQPRTELTQPPFSFPTGTESSPSTATAVPGRHEDGEGGKDRRATTSSVLLHVSRRWLLP
ncbi:Protein of unknown function, partial [Gryllus bimaculatus]